MRRGHRVNMCKSADRARCADTGTWDRGFLVYVDVDGDGRIGPGEPVLEVEGAAPAGITVGANRPVDDYVSYTGLGVARMLNGALQMGTFTLCRQGTSAVKVVVANSGRTRIDATGEACP